MQRDRLERNKVKVVTFTTQYRIEGEIHIPIGGRITDFVNITNTDFIAVTQAKIHHSGQRMDEGSFYESDFLALNKNFVVIILPKGKIEGESGENHGQD